MRLFARVYGAVLRFAPERFRSRYAQDAVDLASVRLRETVQPLVERCRSSHEIVIL